LRERFKGWQAAVLTVNPPLARNLGVYAKRTHRFHNGTIECRLLRFDLDEASDQKPADIVRADWSGRPGAQMFANRLRKNLKLLDAWALREHVECFRVYDADMPEYAFAIDLYGREGRHASDSRTRTLERTGNSLSHRPHQLRVGQLALLGR
jgi:23S rRNA (guanine2445-N2)-methyltransferase / 23S rRNA (guanine2069-N7)-methyltransferase